MWKYITTPGAKQLHWGKWTIVWFFTKHPKEYKWYRRIKAYSYTNYGFGRLSIIHFD